MRKIKPFVLGPEQKIALQDAEAGYNMFITGGGGVGKSVLLREIVRRLTRAGNTVAVAASTGVAAVNVGGVTIHSALGTGINGSIDELKSKRKKDMMERARWRMKGVDTLIVDEVSMLTGSYIDMMDWWLKAVYRSGDAPFGDLQLILVGDLLQLPPVIHGVCEKPYVYMADAWVSGNFRIHYLTKMYRQADNEMQRHLAAIRRNENVFPALEYFNRRVGAMPGPEPTQMFPKNKQVEEVNNRNLRDLPGSDVTYDAEYEGKQQFVAALQKNCIAMDELRLKPGAPVLFLKNNRNLGYYNGMRGVVEECLEESVVVETDDGDIIEVSPEEWSVTGTKGEVLAKMIQIPVKLAWAITIHKCVSGDTRILTADRGMPRIRELYAESVEEGNIRETSVHVVSKDGVSEATQVSCTGIEETRKFVTERGYEIETSLRHPLLVFRDGKTVWVPAPEVVVGDCVVLRAGGWERGVQGFKTDWATKPDDYNGRVKFTLTPSRVTSDFAWLCGIVVGDGNCTDSKDYRVEVTSGDPDVLRRVSSVVDHLFGVRPVISGIRVYWHGKFARTFMRDFGVDYAKAPDKRIPDALWRYPQFYADFLRGLFDADGGSRSDRNVHFTTSSEELASDVQQMLLAVGVVCRRYRMNSRAWRIEILGWYATKFFEVVGFSVSRKQHLPRGPKNIPKFSVGVVPTDIPKRIYAAALEKIGTPHGERKRLHLSGGKPFSAWLRTTDVMSLEQLSEVLRRCPELEDVIAETRLFEVARLASAGCFFDRVQSVDSGEAELFDLYVPDGNNFVGNGFVNHNSQGMTLQYASFEPFGVFAPGQTYVALSRAATYSGLSLLSPVREQQIEVEHCLVHFDTQCLEYARHCNAERLKLET